MRWLAPMFALLGACAFERPEDVGSISVAVRGLWDGSDGIELVLSVDGVPTPLPFTTDGDSAVITARAGTPYALTIVRAPAEHTCTGAATGTLADVLVVPVSCTGPVTLSTVPPYDIDQAARDPHVPTTVLAQLVQIRPSGPDSAVVAIDDMPLVVNTTRSFALAVSDNAYRIAMQSGALSKTVTLTFERGAAPITQDDPMRSPSPMAPAQFGSAIAISPTALLVGTPGKELVRTFSRNGRAWVFGGDIAPPVGASPRFGASVAMQGDALVIGAPDVAMGMRGSAHIYERINNIWVNRYSTTTDVPTQGPPDGDDQLGTAVSCAGTRVIVGGPSRGDNAPVRAYTRNAASSWLFDAPIATAQQTSFDNFGAALALRGTTAIVGARTADGLAPATSNSGRVYTFERATTWTQSAMIEASNREANDAFGTAVALELEGADQILVVGAPGEDGATLDDLQNNALADAGAAYVFRRTGTGPWTQEAYLKPSNRGPSFRFGTAVAISNDLIAVGAPGEDGCATGIDPVVMPGCSGAGAVFVFQRIAGTWRQVSYIKATPSHAQDGFSMGLGLSTNFLVVGAPNEDTDSIDGGAAFPFQ